MAARIGGRPGRFALRPPALAVTREPGTPGILALAKRRPLLLAPTRMAEAGGNADAVAAEVGARAAGEADALG